MAEVLITIAIAVVIITGSISLMMFNSQYIKQQQVRSSAMTLAAMTMEQLFHTPVEELEHSSEDVVIDDNRTPDDEEDDTAGNLRVEIKDLAGNLLVEPPAATDCVEVCITVTWAGSGRASERTYKETLVSYIIQ